MDPRLIAFLVIAALLLVTAGGLLWLRRRRPETPVASSLFDMAVDSASKRISSVQILCPWMLAPPLPDGSISQGDRQHIAWSYSGISAGAAAAIIGGEDEMIFFIMIGR